MKVTRVHTFLSSCLEAGGDCLYGSTFLLKNPHRKVGFLEVIHMYTEVYRCMTSGNRFAKVLLRSCGELCYGGALQARKGGSQKQANWSYVITENLSTLVSLFFASNSYLVLFYFSHLVFLLNFLPIDLLWGLYVLVLDVCLKWESDKELNLVIFLMQNHHVVVFLLCFTRHPF